MLFPGRPLSRATRAKASRTDSSLCYRPPGVTRRVALFRHRLLRAYDDGVRTFLPPSHLAITKPAITRLTRQLDYNSSANRSSYGKVRAISWVAELALDLGRPHLAVARIMLRAKMLANVLENRRRGTIGYLASRSLSNSDSVRIVTPSSLAFSYLE